MATTKPRLTITLDPHTYLVLSTLANLQGESRSKIITDLLDSVVPVLERTARIIQIAKTAETTVTDDMRNAFTASEKKLEKMMNDAMGELDIFDDMIPGSEDDSGAKSSNRDGDKEASDHSQPPYSNRGVRSKPTPKSDQKTKPKKSVKSVSSGSKTSKT